MKYRVTHTTEYWYNETVPLCHNLARLRPRDTPMQTCRGCDIEVWPAAATRRDRIDFFGNHVSWMCIQHPHQRLRISAVSQVEVTAATTPAETGLTWEMAADVLAGSRDPAILAARQFIFDSPHAPATVELADFARISFTPNRPLLESVLNLILRIHAEFTFDAWATSVGTTAMDVLRQRRGVCQDFAHLAIAAMRSLRLAVRYVSGYVVTRPAPGQKRLVGADASHAWISVFLPGQGWADFDPTHGSMPSDQHVTLGWARDYDDIAPVRGVITGGRRHGMSVAVDVEPASSEARPSEC